MIKTCLNTSSSPTLGNPSSLGRLIGPITEHLNTMNASISDTHCTPINVNKKLLIEAAIFVNYKRNRPPKTIIREVPIPKTLHFLTTTRTKITYSDKKLLIKIKTRQCWL